MPRNYFFLDNLVPDDPRRYGPDGVRDNTTFWSTTRALSLYLERCVTALASTSELPRTNPPARRTVAFAIAWQVKRVYGDVPDPDTPFEVAFEAEFGVPPSDFERDLAHNNLLHLVQ